MNQRKKRERKGERDENEGELAWVAWILGNSRRPPNELFSSLPIYFCSLFNQPPSSPSSYSSSSLLVLLVTLGPPPVRRFSFLRESNEPKVLFLRCNNDESSEVWVRILLEQMEEKREAWGQGRYTCYVYIFNKLKYPRNHYPDLQEMTILIYKIYLNG